MDFCVRRIFFRTFFIFNRRCFHIAINNRNDKEHLVNEEIISGAITEKSQIRVIGPEGEQMGIMTVGSAIESAYDKNLDLVLISPNGNPPVCRILDYGKFRFDREKKKKEAKKNQKVVEIKEIRLSLNIDTHDFETKKNHATRFLGEGNKVKVSIRFRGREMGHPELGADIMKRFAEALVDVANVEKPAKLEGRNMLMFLAPKPVK